MQDIFFQISHHPFWGMGAAVAWFVLLVFGIALIVLPIVESTLVRLHAARRARKAARVVPHWPALVKTTPHAWDLMLLWAGVSGRFPKARTSMVISIVFIALGFFVSGLTVGIVSVMLIVLILFFLFARAKKSKDLFIRQLPDGLQSLVDTLRAGYSLPQAIIFLARETSPPMQKVFQALARAQELDLEFFDALERVAAQLAVREWTMVAETLAVQQRLGGNIVPFLEETARTVRDRITAESEIKTMTAAGRMSGFLIAGLVPLVLAFFFFLSPLYISVLFETEVGRVLFALALVLEVVGFVWIRKVVTIDY